MKGQRGRAFKVRLAVLLAVLAVVMTYALHDRYQREQRRAWQRSLEVALIVVQEPGIAPEAMQRLRARVSALEAALAVEARRYTTLTEPFHFVFYGPISGGRAAPERGAGGLWDLLSFSWSLFRFTHDVDERAGVPTRGFDSRLYLVVRRPRTNRAVVEGAGEQGGRIGLATAELDDEMADFALFVATHELFHTLGATDKYDASGHTLVPEGLADPAQVPLFPQRRAEIMARNRPLSPNREVPPLSLAELGVGPKTAREIGWTR